VSQCSRRKDAAVLHRFGLSDEECDRGSERSMRLNLAQSCVLHGSGPVWTAEELALLGTMPDEVARLLVRSASGVRPERTRRGIPNPLDRRWSEHRRVRPPAQ
jgi:hypothetical protein